VHAFTFSSIIPQDFKLLFVDCVEVIWVTILSAAVNRDAEKALQVPLNAEAERPAAQLQEQLDAEFTTSVTDGAGGLTVECDYDVETLPRRGSGSYYEDLENATGVCEFTSVDVDDPRVDADAATRAAGTAAGATTASETERETERETARSRVDEEAMSSR
jgi:protein Mpv17